MKTRIVLWGKKNEEKVLVGIELLASENAVNIYCIPENIATEAFYNLMMNTWREGGTVEFPEGHELVKRPLTVADSILPDEIKVDRVDLIHRAQTEWHFVVLSAKLNDVYKQELNDLKERISHLNEFNKGLWEELKGFWGKVQEQVREKNLFREHANKLREETNALFDQLKSHRKTLDKEFKAKSEEATNIVMGQLEDIEERIKKGLGLKPIFEDLKVLQSKFRDMKMTRRDRDKVWKRLDTAFKTIKEKRFGSKEGGSGKLERLTRRYDGLVNAIAKMESSIDRDRKDISFQERRIQNTDGQLEAQIREAKLKMIKERISSKETKLEDMKEIEKRLVEQISQEKAKAEKAKLMEEAKKAAEQKIAENIASAEEGRKEEEEKLSAAAEKIKKAKETTKNKKEDSLVEAISTTVGESLDDVMDTIKAVAEVVSDRASEVYEEVKENIKEALEEE